MILETRLVSTAKEEENSSVTVTPETEMTEGETENFGTGYERNLTVSVATVADLLNAVERLCENIQYFAGRGLPDRAKDSAEQQQILIQRLRGAVYMQT